MNLIICCTPFQARLSKEIIKLSENDEFIQLMISPIDNQKHRYYYSLLADDCVESLFLYRKQSLISWLFSYIRILFFLRGKKIKKIYLSNINDELIHMIVDLFHNASIYTFDDGTANIIKSSSFYYRKIKKTSQILRCVLGVKTNTDYIKNNSKIHYTIYNNVSNIINNTYPVNIFSCCSREDYKKSKVNRIFLGQPFYISDKENVELISKLVEDLGIDFYIPHPREEYSIKNVRYVFSELIFEDLFNKDFINENCEIYTFCSGAILSLLGGGNTKLVSILPKYINNTVIPKDTLLECYSLFNKLGVEIMEID